MALQCMFRYHCKQFKGELFESLQTDIIAGRLKGIMGCKEGEINTYDLTCNE